MSTHDINSWFTTCNAWDNCQQIFSLFLIDSSPLLDSASVFGTCITFKNIFMHAPPCSATEELSDSTYATDSLHSPAFDHFFDRAASVVAQSLMFPFSPSTSFDQLDPAIPRNAVRRGRIVGKQALIRATDTSIWLHMASVLTEADRLWKFKVEKMAIRQMLAITTLHNDQLRSINASVKTYKDPNMKMHVNAIF